MRQPDYPISTKAHTRVLTEASPEYIGESFGECFSSCTAYLNKYMEHFNVLIYTNYSINRLGRAAHEEFKLLLTKPNNVFK